MFRREMRILRILSTSCLGAGCEFDGIRGAVSQDKCGAASDATNTAYQGSKSAMLCENPPRRQLSATAK